MYEVYVMIWKKWKLVERVDTIQQVDIVVKKLYQDYSGLSIQILKDGNYLTGLDGTDYHYFYFYHKYVLKLNNYDYIKEYEKQKKLN